MNILIYEYVYIYILINDMNASMILHIPSFTMPISQLKSPVNHPNQLHDPASKKVRILQGLWIVASPRDDLRGELSPCIRYDKGYVRVHIKQIIYI